jgi:hypothetical protein
MGYIQRTTTDGGYMSTGSYLVRRGIYQSQHLEEEAKDNAELSRQRHGADEGIARPGSVEKPTQDEVITKDPPDTNSK